MATGVDRSLLYRSITYVLLTVVAFVLMVPTLAAWTGREEPAWMRKHLQKKIMLGLDLQGGLHLVYEVQVDKAVSDKADRLATDLEEKLHKDKKVKDVRVERFGIGELRAQFKNPEDVKKIDREFLKDYQKYLFEDARDAVKGTVTLKIDSDYVDELKDYAVRQGVETIRNRVDKLAVAEPTIIRKGTDIVVE